MNVSKYRFLENAIINERLFLKGDEVYIESYDPRHGNPQSLFLPDRTFLGKISSDFFWKINKFLEMIKD
jgi:hypothetical protein